MCACVFFSFFFKCNVGSLQKEKRRIFAGLLIFLIIFGTLLLAEHHRGHHNDHVHDSAVSSVSIVSEGTLDLDEVIFHLISLCVLPHHVMAMRQLCVVF